jgi:serine O-acetyltransferase
MQIAISRSRLIELLESQIRHNFLLEDDERPAIEATLDRALERTATCFEPNKNKYYRKDGALYFSPYQSAQYCIFLYYFANTLWRAGGAGFLCDKLYLLNKMLNGIDLFYQVEMPDVFYTDHPVGTVLGRAKYGRGFGFNQGCTVGNNKGVYPVIGENVRMYSGSRILGNCRIGDNVIISSGCFVKDTDVPDCTVVFGQSPNLVFKQRDPSYFVRAT